MNASGGEDEDGPNLAPPGEGYELYRHRNAERIPAGSWRGYYWARRTAEGDYEIRTVPSSLGEPSAPGGIFPKEGFERFYAPARREDL